MPLTVDLIPDVVKEAVDTTPVIDVHTHLYRPRWGKCLLHGIDELLTYHYLTVETLRVLDMDPSQFFGMTKEKQANHVWKTLFIERSPVSEACKGIITTLTSLGLDAKANTLDGYREFFEHVSLEERVDTVFKLAGVESVVMTNDPFDESEIQYWASDEDADTRFRAALRLDVLLNSWPEAAEILKSRGYDVCQDASAQTLREADRFIRDSVDAIKPVYFAVSLPPSFQYPDESIRGVLLEQVIIPYCVETGIPLALMIGVKKSVNPRMGLGGDSVGKASIVAVEHLCEENPRCKFLVTMLARENQHELCVSARKFPNLMIFGCWWFLNNPSLIAEITNMRIEMLGLSFIPQHSDARVFEQLIYKWRHSRAVLSHVLTEQYVGLAETGWPVTADDIRNDVELLLHGNARDFLNL